MTVSSTVFLNIPEFNAELGFRKRLLVTKMINRSYNGVEIGTFYKLLCIYFYPAGSAFSDESDQCYYWCTGFSNHLRVPNFEENIVFSLT